MSFNKFILQKQYERIQGLGDRLELMKQVINWESFRKLVAGVFFDNKEIGGRPHTDEILVVKVMVLQSCYNLSDPELEFQVCDRLSFRNFLGFPESVPDFSTIWKIRERLKNADVDKLIWDELQRQLNDKGYKIKRGVIQDASFIEANIGKKRYYKEKKAEAEGKEVQYTEKQKRHIDKDGSFSVKNNQIHYGYKIHVKSDVDNHLIRDYETTTASVHDSKIDLIKDGDIAAYRDKGYFGKKIEAKGVIDKTMQRATRAKKLNKRELKRNGNISRIRSVGERPFAVIKNVFKNGYTNVKTLGRVSIKEMFKFLSYNLYQLVTLEMKQLA